jgi:hypothetical protein
LVCCVFFLYISGFWRRPLDHRVNIIILRHYKTIQRACRRTEAVRPEEKTLLRGSKAGGVTPSHWANGRALSSSMRCDGKVAKKQKTKNKKDRNPYTKEKNTTDQY